MTSAVPAFTNPVIRYTDIFPATVSPLPDGVSNSRKLRAIITNQFLTIGWDGPQGQPLRVDIPLQEGDIGDEVTYAGGTVLGITVGRRGVCGSCGGGNKIRSWQPFPGAQYIEQPRKETALRVSTGRNRVMTGLPSVRYERRR